MSHFKNKYLKYKSKYLQLKNIKYNQSGGDLPIFIDVNAINKFTDPDMELYMNPIHGLVYCNTDYIPNIYWLNKSEFINQKLMPHLSELSLADLKKKGVLITKVCKDIPGNIQPSNVFMDLKPIDYGRYIAIKYFNNKHQFISINLIKNKIIIDQKLIKEEEIREILNNYIDKIRTLIPILDNDLFTFQIILYCVCWVSNNDNGIADYYKGIKEVFDLLSSIKGICIPPLVLQRQEKTNSFEEIVVNTIQQEFKIYNQEWAQNFCNESQLQKYPDCGEITVLNLINLLIFNSSVFDISLLPSSSLPELVEFYRVFTNFNQISDINYKPEIYCQQLNARDAWSYLIIKYAYKNLRLIKPCLKGNYKYELDAGLSVDNKTPNFLQLIKNLLGIDNWKDLENVNIMNIQDNTKDGIGDINIQHNRYDSFKIHCESGHYYMSNTYKKGEYLHLSKLTPQQQNTINILIQNIQPTIENYLDINLSSELLEETFRSSSIELKKVLLILSLTGKYDSDLRRRMKIDVDDVNFFNWIADIFNDKKYNEKIQDYTYQSNDFKFMERMPSLRHLNSEIKKNLTIKEIDLSPLSKLESVGNSFLMNCRALISIDLSPLSNLKSIGDSFLQYSGNFIIIDLCSLSNLKSVGSHFMFGCRTFKSINLSHLSNLKSVGNSFLSMCSALTSIDLYNLSNLESIGNNFLSDCSALKSIDLRPLSNLKSVGSRFMVGCSALKSIDLSHLSNLKSVGSRFIVGCVTLKSIDLSHLSNLKSFGDYFLSDCSALTRIYFSPLSNLESVGDSFLSGCSALTSIDVCPLSNLKSLGNYFLLGCRGLTSIDLRSLSNLESIGNYFLKGCRGLTGIDLSPLSKLESIGDYFLFNCNNLKSINLSLSKLELIGDYFLSGCSGLTSIDLRPLSNLKSIGYYFLSGCRGLTSIDLRSLSNLESIGNNFLSDCSSLISIDLRSLSKLESIRNNFLMGCISLVSIELSNLKSIGKNFLKGCISLVIIDFRSLIKLESIGYDFMKECSKLTTIFSIIQNHKLLQSKYSGKATFRIGY